MTNVRQLRKPLKPVLIEPEQARAAGVRSAELWPATAVGLGPKTIGPFTECEDCGAGTWVRYGGRACCLPCARGRAG